MIENDDGGCKAGLIGLAEFPTKKPTDESAERGGSVSGYFLASLARYTAGISN
jgi:hypothetical protein